MSNIAVTIELPEDVAGDRSSADLARDLRMYAVFESLCRGEISTGRAASLLGVTRPELLFIAAQHGVPSVNYSADELEEDLADLAAARRTG